MTETVDVNIEQVHRRFSDAPWFKKYDQYITIGGIGSIGSWTSLFLARAGFPKMVIFEDDHVDEINLAGQLYKNNDVGRSKIDSIRTILYEFSSSTIQVMGRYESNSLSTEIMIASFDNMIARKSMFTNWRKNPKRLLFIDGRLTAEQFEIFFITPDREEAYLAHLYEESEVEDLPCSFKYTSHFSALIAGNIVKGLTNFITNLEAKDEIRDVPFHYSEFGALFTSEIANK